MSLHTKFFDLLQFGMPVYFIKKVPLLESEVFCLRIKERTGKPRLILNKWVFHVELFEMIQISYTSLLSCGTSLMRFGD